MRKLFCLTILAFASCNGNRAKRFAGLNVAGIGGSTGCVVTGSKLFLNGFYLRDLTAEEQQEITDYQDEARKYRAELKVVAQKRSDALSQSSSVHVFRDNSKVKLPEPPKKPSFCASVDTTQYYFDGCMVQNNKVYVGREYARNLNDEEIKQLQEFDEKMKVYQKYVSEQVKERIKDVDWLRGDNLVKLLLGQDITNTKERIIVTTEAPTTRSSEIKPVPPELPETPDFCTAIY